MVESRVVLVLLPVGGHPSHPELGYATWDGAWIAKEGVEGRETVDDDGEEGEGVVEAEYSKECVGDGREGGADEDGEDGGGEEEECAVGERVDGLAAVEDEMGGLGGGQIKNSGQGSAQVLTRAAARTAQRASAREGMGDEGGEELGRGGQT